MRVHTVEEFRLDFHNSFEAEGVSIQHLRQRNIAALRFPNRRHGIDRADALAHGVEIRRFDKVGLVENDDVRKGDLLLRLMRAIQRTGEMLRVNNSDNRVETRVLATSSSTKKVCATGAGSASPVRLDQDSVETATPEHQAFDDADEIAAHRATDAAIIHLEDLLVAVDDEIVIDPHFAELIADNNGVALAMVLAQHAVE